LRIVECGLKGRAHNQSAIRNRQSAIEQGG